MRSSLHVTTPYDSVDRCQCLRQLKTFGVFHERLPMWRSKSGADQLGEARWFLREMKLYPLRRVLAVCAQVRSQAELARTNINGPLSVSRQVGGRVLR